MVNRKTKIIFLALRNSACTGVQHTTYCGAVDSFRLSFSSVSLDFPVLFIELQPRNKPFSNEMKINHLAQETQGSLHHSLSFYSFYPLIVIQLPFRSIYATFWTLCSNFSIAVLMKRAGTYESTNNLLDELEGPSSIWRECINGGYASVFECFWLGSFTWIGRAGHG